MERSIDDLTLAQLRVLVATVDGGSFTAAASQAGISRAAVSKIITRLEKRLGAPLFIRTTRQMRLTETGAHYVTQCRQALATLDDATAAAMGGQATPTGALRISVSASFAYWRLFPRLRLFREQFPDISLQIQISDRPANIAGDAFDLAIRGYNMADSTMKARKIEDAELVVVAAPAYLAKAPALGSLADLALHQCIQFRLPESGRPSPWMFLNDGEHILQPTAGGISCEDEYLAGAALAKSGAGLYQIYRFVVDDALKTGQLIEVLTEFGGASRPFYAVFPGGAPSARLRVFMDFLHGDAGRIGVR